jgi:hypothetical protein
MSGKLGFFLVCLLFIASAARGSFETVGLYDPNDEPYHNQVGYVGVYESHTGDAGPQNVVDLAVFKPLIGNAFNLNAGSVIDVQSGTMEEQDVVARFGVGKFNSLSDKPTLINVIEAIEPPKSP